MVEEVYKFTVDDLESYKLIKELGTGGWGTMFHYEFKNKFEQRGSFVLFVQTRSIVNLKLSDAEEMKRQPDQIVVRRINVKLTKKEKEQLNKEINDFKQVIEKGAMVRTTDQTI